MSIRRVKTALELLIVTMQCVRHPPRAKARGFPEGDIQVARFLGSQVRFRVELEGRHRVVTNGVLFSAYSSVNGAFLPVSYRRQRRLAIQSAG
jgi:hypothetical protein